MEQKKNNFKIVSDKKARIILPNAITLIGVCIGLTSIKFAIDGKFAIAIIAILLNTWLSPNGSQTLSIPGLGDVEYPFRKQIRSAG